MPHAAVRSDPANYGRRAVPALRDCNLTRSDMFHPCRLLVFLTLVFVSLLASSPAFATRDTPEDEKSREKVLNHTLFYVTLSSSLTLQHSNIFFYDRQG